MSKLDWIPFYEEMADKLLEYKNNRKQLCALILKTVPAEDRKLLQTDKNGTPPADIDPFSVYSLFTRNYNKRWEIARLLKTALNISAPVPTDHKGIPTQNNMNASFVAYEAKQSPDGKDRDRLWELADIAVNNPSQLSTIFDQVLKQPQIKIPRLTMGLYYLRPQEYLSLDVSACAYLKHYGIETNKVKNFSDYSALLNKVKAALGNTIKETSLPELSWNAYANPENATQTPRQYWLVGCMISKQPKKDEFVEQGIWQGHFAYKKAKSQIEDVRKIKVGDCLILKSTGTKGPNNNQPFLRVKAVGLVTEIIGEEKHEEHLTYTCKVDYYSDEEVDFDESTYGQYQKTIHPCNDDKLIEYAKECLGEEPQDRLGKYVEMLTKCRNIVFTGAPGTGKSYLAHEIAREIAAEEDIEFVQFHPSFDYTDFVEGLRPAVQADGQMGFELKDGVFKEFCARALENWMDVQKGDAAIGREEAARKILDEFLNDAVENETQMHTSKLKTPFVITGIRETKFDILADVPKVKNLVVNKSDVIELLVSDANVKSVGEVKTILGHPYNTQQDSYIFVIYQLLKNKIKPVEAKKVDKKDFVFIIDEINRGELSKIFGELFFSLDVGYRGTKGKVRTQYANLQDSPNVFDRALHSRERGHFFVPENVYIIGTMNDIDRSVESIDFALRRRFFWNEITAEESFENIIAHNPKFSPKQRAEIRVRMDHLNQAIVGTYKRPDGEAQPKVPGLNTSYQIGASYFLDIANNVSFEDVWNYRLRGLLFEYLRGERDADALLQSLKYAYDDTSENVAAEDDAH